ncbi:hypothetical protein C7212DRAFT_362365 [Tuber magnatum]|uniref:Uncharacterized protein n=1 Tax=Tuber magnatum TaxID=42249 RepID=A0A317SU68_9PEZI|nr:hypothetical protein C7212DRAFT_362365 [Tuber magnatum]
MIRLSHKRPFDERLAWLMQWVRRELRGLDALSSEDSGVIEAAIAEVRRANTDTVKALFPLIAHVNHIDDCLIRRQDMWDTTRAVLLWFGGISDIGQELQDVATLCAEEEEYVKLKGKYLEGMLQAELRGREDLEDEISEELDRCGGRRFEADRTKASADSARAVILALGLAFTYTIPGVFTFGFCASISVVTFLASWTKILRTSQLREAAEAYKEAQHLFSLLSPRAGSMQLITSRFETLLSRRKTLAENRVTMIRNIRPPHSPSWYRHSRADVVSLLEEILNQFKQDYEEDTITSEEEAITANLEEQIGYLRSKTKTLQKIHIRIRAESDGIQDPYEMQRGSWEHLRLSTILLIGTTMAVFYAWSHRQYSLQGAMFVARQTRRSILWTLKGTLIKLWQTTVNLLFGLRTPFLLLCSLAPSIMYFALNVSMYLSRLALDYAFRLPLKVLLVVVFLLFRVFTIRVVVLGVMGWFLTYHGPAWDEIWHVVYDWVVWGVLTGWKWLWEFSEYEEACQALVIAS